MTDPRARGGRLLVLFLLSACLGPEPAPGTPARDAPVEVLQP